MPPLTSPTGCDRCPQLSQTVLDHRHTIAELEGSISNLYYIQDEEDFMDSLGATVGATNHAPTEPDLDITIPVAVS
ncbi:hypothetical protein ABVT39_000605 [Epinephelus coioides]